MEESICFVCVGRIHFDHVFFSRRPSRSIDAQTRQRKTAHRILVAVICIGSSTRALTTKCKRIRVRCLLRGKIYASPL